jgi:hypothetical protein
MGWRPKSNSIGVSIRQTDLRIWMWALVGSNHRPPPCKRASQGNALTWAGAQIVHAHLRFCCIDALRPDTSFSDLSRNLCGISGARGSIGCT